MKISNFLAFLLFCLLSNFTNSYSQDLVDPDFYAPIEQDTICVEYELLVGDTLLYRIDSYDSIIINFGQPLLKIRKEIIEIVVDSVGEKSGNYHLTQTMVSTKSIESNAEEKDIERDTHPWVGQKAFYEIDSFGKRYSFSTNDSNTYILSPSGAFAPVIFFDLGINCELEKNSWIVRVNDELPENGVPFPLTNYTSLFNFRDDIDTLGENCNRLEFVRTGESSYSYYNNDIRYRTTNVTNGFGIIDIGKESKIPLHLYFVDEQKLTFHKPSGKTFPGQHFLNVNFTLIERKRKELSSK